MTKYVIIAGAPRAGKSTVSKYLSRAYNYQHISMDAIIAGLESVFPEGGINSNVDYNVETNVRGISEKIARFIQAMITSGEYDECDYGVVIDVYQLLPEDYIKYINHSVCEIYYFITADVSPAERLKILNDNDTPNDYTYYETNEKKRGICEEIVAISKIMKKQCVQFELPYYETSYNRERVIQTFVKNL